MLAYLFCWGSIHNIQYNSTEKTSPWAFGWYSKGFLTIFRFRPGRNGVCTNTSSFYFCHRLAASSHLLFILIYLPKSEYRSCATETMEIDENNGRWRGKKKKQRAEFTTHAGSFVLMTTSSPVRRDPWFAYGLDTTRLPKLKWNVDLGDW